MKIIVGGGGTSLHQRRKLVLSIAVLVLAAITLVAVLRDPFSTWWVWVWWAVCVLACGDILLKRLREDRERLRAGVSLPAIVFEWQSLATALALAAAGYMWLSLPGLQRHGRPADSVWFWLFALCLTPVEFARKMKPENRQRWWAAALTAAGAGAVVAGAVLASAYWWGTPGTPVHRGLGIAALSAIVVSVMLVIAVGFAAWLLTPSDPGAATKSEDGGQ